MYPNFLSKSMSLSTPRRQRAPTNLDSLPLSTPASPKSQSFGKDVASAAKNGLQNLLRHPRENTFSTRRSELSLLPSSVFSAYSSEPPVLILPASAFGRTLLLPALHPEPQKDAPKRRHTYKLFPSSSPPPQIISPVYSVNVLHRNIGSKDYKVVLPRLRETQNYSSFNSTPPIGTKQNPKVIHMRRRSSTDKHPLTVSNLIRQGKEKEKEKNEDHKKSHMGMRESQPRTFHKENINCTSPLRPRPNGNMHGLKLGHCLRIKSQSPRHRLSLLGKTMDAIGGNQKDTDSNITRRYF